MKKTTPPLILQRELSLPKWLGIRHQRQVGAVLNILFGISCWSGVAWLVWNHALANFFNSGSIGPLLSLVFGAFLYAMSTILGDREPDGSTGMIQKKISISNRRTKISYGPKATNSHH